MNENPNAAPAAGEASTEAVVRVSGLTKIFKDFWHRPKAKAVNNVSFEIRRGEVFGLLGPNGSGKSTTIKMLLGLLKPTAGLIQVFGRSPRDVRMKARIGYLPEESYLYKYLDSEETLDFFGNLFGLDAKERHKRTEQLLDMVGLKRVQMRTVGEFSKGMQRRIGLAQALINDPDLVILDEPTAGMDPIGCREIKDLILTLAQRGKTVILSSHLLSDVEDVCDRAVIYYGGKIQAYGELKDLLVERDTVRITMPVLPQEKMKYILDVIRADVAADRVQVDNPTQNLENYFLNIVKRARQSEDTSGATSGNQVAEYLRGNEPVKSAIDKKIERLTAAKVEPVAVAVAPKPEDKVDQKRLATLTSAKPTADTTPAAAKPDAVVDAAKANAKLSSLLGGDKKQP
ncbi:MAG: ABC transporter ATP-binding protein [Pedosphaera sp.]|nr:ABC transporter ATP-binding protein [Pedosphaera sp.]MSU42889.1 ABC transporter ATP-binding protein [Pedosphaera sp.]